MRHIRNPIRLKLWSKGTSTPMMRRTRPSKVIFSLEIKLLRAETNKLITARLNYEVWHGRLRVRAPSAPSYASPSAAFCQLCVRVADKRIPVPPTLQAHAVLQRLLKMIGWPPVGLRCSEPLLSLRIRCAQMWKAAAVKMVKIRQERTESLITVKVSSGTRGAEPRYFQGAVKVVYVLHLRGNADTL